MLISPQTIHDLKTDRADILPPLPHVMRLIPVAFYLVTLAALALLAATVIQIRTKSVTLETVRAETVNTNQQIEETRAARSALEGRAKRAADILTWVEGSNAIQPLTVAIGRSVGARAGVTELLLSRSEKSSQQIQIAMKLQGADAAQIEPIIDAIQRSDFRPFSAKQSQEGNKVNYEATLIRQTGQTTVIETTETSEVIE